MLEKKEDQTMNHYTVIFRGDPIPGGEDRYKWEFKRGFDNYVSAVSYCSTLPAGRGALVLDGSPVAMILDNDAPPLERAAAWDHIANEMEQWPEDQQIADMSRDRAVASCRTSAAQFRKLANRERT